MNEVDVLDLGELDFSEFESFWKAYPRRRDRRRAEGAFARARKLASHDEIMTATRAYATQVEGQPLDRIRWPIEWLRAEPWKPEVETVALRPVARARRRRNPSKPRRAQHKVTRVRPLTAEEQKAKWCREHGVAMAEYEQRKGDAEWLERIMRRGIVAT